MRFTPLKPGGPHVNLIRNRFKTSGASQEAWKNACTHLVPEMTKAGLSSLQRGKEVARERDQ